VNHDLRVAPDADALAGAAARWLGETLGARAGERSPVTLALSGGTTPWRMVAHLGADEVPWAKVELYQVDERVVPTNSELRNLRHLDEGLGASGARIVAMEVDDPDLEAAARRYDQSLPDHLDVVHLGLGADGHCASLVPGDPVLEVTDRRVALTAHPYQGNRRMTLTYPALAAAHQLVWLVSGADKREALARLLEGDRSIPAGRVRAESSIVFCDAAARGE
jgi:6-phosphogluconolactonase